MVRYRIEGTDCGVAIYALCDPLTEEIRYIGQTWHPAKRYEQHLWSARVHGTMGTPKDAWIASLLSRGTEPCFYWLDWVWAEDAERVEREQIVAHRARGCPLFNGPVAGHEPVHIGTTVPRVVHQQIADLTVQWDVSVASAVRRLLAEALAARAAREAARAAAVPAAPALTQEARS